ncbi:hypothetical protein HA48_14540 [Pantoea wallisii]|uniref:Uncharacterized protein n=1 Tax=Pantoea wallisii TaxID=1076551 RepID=A0A1X1D6S0_9GAMM|nr:hypothetical protein [Pantoea wallisii]ORM72373.1 hypothetical protein HA48_14540 [Pantoea wallisii]
MAKDGKHVIHAGGVFPNPLLNREGAAAAATAPGTIGFFDAAKFTASVAGAESAILYVANMDYLRCMGVDDAIAAGENVVAIQPLPGLFLNVRAAAGTYKKGQPVAVANGRITAVAADAAVFAYVEEDKPVTAVAGDLIRVVFK